MTPQDRAQRVLITIAVMSATVMQVLDMTIVNVALPHMQGELNAAPDQITWVLTSYLVASAIFMPLTGYFADRFGQKNFLLVSILGFVIASTLCGIATNLPEMVVFRLLQGVFGAALVPLSQSIMVDTFPVQQRGRAMAIWGIGVMVGPILGPTLGGYLTESLDWRWTFYINVPVGILSFLLAWSVVPHTERRARTMDWSGFLLLALAIGGLQLVLDRGNVDDWFNSRSIQLSALASAIGLVAFVYHAAFHKKSTLFHLDIFADRNFSTSTFLLTVFGLGLFGSIVLQPLMLESLLGYPASTTGLLMAPRGVASMISMMVVGRIITRVSPRTLIAAGIVISAAGSYAMTGYSLYSDAWALIWPVIFQGFGLGMIFVPLSTVAFTTLPRQRSAEAAGIYSLMRTVGSSVGISIATTVLTRHTQMAWNQLGGHIEPFNPALSQYFSGLHLALPDPRAVGLLAYELGRQAQMTGLLDAFMLVTWSFLFMLPLVLLLRRGETPSKGVRAPAAE
jgi:DHA2 family multidrug resistance protein